MSTEVTLKINSTSSNATEQLGENVGKNLKGGETIELISDLGGGKTTFVRGLAKGIGSLDQVASPTFTLSRQYHTQDLSIHHFDFFRLNEPGVVVHELAESLHDPSVVVVIEWADIVQGVLPVKRLKVLFKSTGETKRQITFKYPKSLEYLIKDIK